MKHLILRVFAALALSVSTLGASAQSESEGSDPNCFVFVDINGVETEFFGNRVYCETTADGSRVVRAVAQTDDYSVDLTFPMKSLSWIKNEYREKAGIVLSIVSGQSTEMKFDAGVIRISGVKGGAQLLVYNAAGKLVASNKVEAESSAFSLDSLPAGVYIAKLNDVTLKIAKK